MASSGVSIVVFNLTFILPLKDSDAALAALDSDRGHASRVCKSLNPVNLLLICPLRYGLRLNLVLRGDTMSRCQTLVKELSFLRRLLNHGPECLS